MVPSIKIENSGGKRLAEVSKQEQISFGHALFEIVCEEVQVSNLFWTVRYMVLKLGRKI